MITPQYQLDIHHELIIDNFAGGGGASTGIELATGRHVDIAINHDAKAVAMHTANHPQTKHYCESVWEVNPREITEGRPVALVWLSPDCKHFSKAKGGKPVEKKMRGLAWVALKWASLPKETSKPRVIMLENVEEFITWGPLGDDDKPCKKNKGREFRAFVNALNRQGYTVEWKALRACDYGAPTIRRRLFLIARCDGQPIVWPEATHAAPDNILVKAKQLKPWRTAAECIDFNIPCPSIFERKKPLADATQRRVAKGIFKYVVNAKKPFIVTMAHGEGTGKTKRWGKGIRQINEPMPTITASGGYGLVAPFITEHANASNQRSMAADEPLRTLCAQVKGGHFSVVAPIISTYYGEKTADEVRGIDLDQPLQTQTTENRHALVTSFLAQFNTTGNGKPNVGHSHDEPISTILASGTMQGLVTTSLDREMHSEEVRAFLLKYYGTDQDPQLNSPLHTITTKDRFGLVIIKGCVYQITDIGLRMLWPVELFKAQGFPDSYIYDRGLVYDQHGNLVWIKLTKTEQVRMVGNSVSPPVAKALVAANLPSLAMNKTKKSAFKSQQSLELTA